MAIFGTIAIDVALTIAGLFLLAGGCLALGRGESKGGLIALAVFCLIEACALGDLAATQRGLDLSGLIGGDLVTILNQGIVKGALVGGFIMLALFTSMILLIWALLVPPEEKRKNYISL